LQQFIDEDIWDEAIVIKNENLKLENGTKAPEFDIKPERAEIFRDNLIQFYKREGHAV